MRDSRRSSLAASTRARTRAPSASGIQRGFTLMELMVVIALLLVLAGMLLPMLTQAKRSSLRTVTLSIMAKTDAALRQYKSDFRGYPYQLSYATTDPVTSWTNALGYNLGTTISAENAANVRADMASAAGDYAYDISPFLANSHMPVAASVHTFVHNRQSGKSSHDYLDNPDGDLCPKGTWQPSPKKPVCLEYDTSSGEMTYGWSPMPSIATCVLLNRMAAERAADLMLIGAVHATGVKMATVTYQGLTHEGRDLSGTPLVAAPKSEAAPGWASDYLQGEIDQNHLRGSAILDGWHRPLIYVCQVLPGVEPCVGQICGNGVNVTNPSLYGMQPAGRSTLEPCLPGSNTPITADADTLPDVGNLMHSDRRVWAAPGYELEFELWSAGPDGVFSWWREDRCNRDNIAAEPYDAAIGTQP